VNDLISTRVDQARALLLQARDSKDAKKVADMAHAAEIYARRQRLSQESIDYAHGVKVDAMTLLGQFLEHQPMSNGGDRAGKKPLGGSRKEPANPKPTLAENGISKKESSLSQKLFKMSKEQPDKHQAIRSAQTPISSAFSSAHVSRNSGENEWYTPAEFIESARTVLGIIDLDPASSKAANAVVKATQFYDKEENGLNQDWNGRVWLNPPYQSGLIQQFTEKLRAAFTARKVTYAICLVNNATETQWFQNLASEASALCFPSSRIKFWNPSKFTASPLQGQTLIYLGSNTRMFNAEFQQYGIICHVIRGKA
jgi:phage N-6-adenine-methyltransferase